MLGGAVGAVAGKLNASMVCNGVIGLVVGAMVSVVIHGALFMLVAVAARMLFQVDLDDRTIGGYKGDWLASVLGSTAAFCGALLVMLVLPAQSLREPHAFVLCWSVVATVPLGLILALLWRHSEVR